MHMCTLSLRTLFHGIGELNNTPRNRLSTRPKRHGSSPAPDRGGHSLCTRSTSRCNRIIFSCANGPTNFGVLKQCVCHTPSILLSVEGGAGERRLEPLWRRGICIYMNVYMNAYGYVQASDNQYVLNYIYINKHITLPSKTSHLHSPVTSTEDGPT